MILHNILKGFVVTGFDDYLVKAITQNRKTVKQVLVHPKKGKEFWRRQQVNADAPKQSQSHSSAPSDDEQSHSSQKDQKSSQHSQDNFLEREVEPGVTWKAVVGPYPDDRHLSVKDKKTPYFPHFHKLYTSRLMGKRTGGKIPPGGRKIVGMDYVHFPKRLDERGYALVKDYPAIKEQFFKGKNPEKAIYDLPYKVQRKIMDLDSQQEERVADLVKQTLLHPAFTLPGSNHTTSQGSTVYVTWDCCVVVVNLPNNEGVIKTMYPTSLVYRMAMEQGWDGTVPIEEFKNKMNGSGV